MDVMIHGRAVELVLESDEVISPEDIESVIHQAVIAEEEAIEEYLTKPEDDVDDAVDSMFSANPKEERIGKRARRMRDARRAKEHCKELSFHSESWWKTKYQEGNHPDKYDKQCRMEARYRDEKKSLKREILNAPVELLEDTLRRRRAEIFDVLASFFKEVEVPHIVVENMYACDLEFAEEIKIWLLSHNIDEIPEAILPMLFVYSIDEMEERIKVEKLLNMESGAFMELLVARYGSRFKEELAWKLVTGDRLYMD